jgi:5-methylcytosine-specific restriction endonuclease McrA
MKIKRTDLPWAKISTRSNPDPFYKSPTWKKTRQAFKLGSTQLPDGRQVPNHLCIDCYKEGKITSMYVVDHIVRIKDGGSKTDMRNLQGLCEHHHAIKSSAEGKQKPI